MSPDHPRTRFRSKRFREFKTVRATARARRGPAFDAVVPVIVVDGGGVGPLGIRARQQRPGGQSLASFADDLTLAQDHPVLMADRPYQEDPPAAGGPGPTAGLCRREPRRAAARPGWAG